MFNNSFGRVYERVYSTFLECGFCVQADYSQSKAAPVFTYKLLSYVLYMVTWNQLDLVQA